MEKVFPVVAVSADEEDLAVPAARASRPENVGKLEISDWQ